MNNINFDYFREVLKGGEPIYIEDENERDEIEKQELFKQGIEEEKKLWLKY